MHSGHFIKAIVCTFVLVCFVLIAADLFQGCVQELYFLKKKDSKSAIHEIIKCVMEIIAFYNRISLRFLCTSLEMLLIG